MNGPPIQHDLFIKFGSEYGSEEERAVLDVLRQNAPTSGEACLQFEQDFAEYCGTRYARCVSNGTAALFLSLVALEIKPGDRVITTPLTWIATGGGRRYARGRRRFRRHRSGDLQPRPDQLSAAITPATKAIIPVHLYGQCCDMDAILAIAGEHGIAVVEDAARPSGAVQGSPGRFAWARPGASAFTSRRTCRPSAKAA